MEFFRRNNTDGVTVSDAAYQRGGATHNTKSIFACPDHDIFSPGAVSMDDYYSWFLVSCNATPTDAAWNAGGFEKNGFPFLV